MAKHGVAEGESVFYFRYKGDGLNMGKTKFDDRIKMELLKEDILIAFWISLCLGWIASSLLWFKYFGNISLKDIISLPITAFTWMVINIIWAIFGTAIFIFTLCCL